MTVRLLLLRALLLAAALAGIATLSVPIIFVFFLVGGAPQGGATSLWKISPLLSSLTALLIVGFTSLAIRQPAEGLRGHLLTIGIGLLLACFSTLAYTFSPFASFGFHPFAVFAVFCSGLMLLGAAFLAQRSREPHGFRFGLRAVVVWVALAALIFAFVHAAAS